MWVTSPPDASVQPLQGWTLTPVYVIPAPRPGWVNVPVALLSGNGTLRASVVPIYPGRAHLNGLGTLTTKALHYLQPNLNSTGTLTGTATIPVPFAVPLSSSGSLSATTMIPVPISVNFSGGGTLGVPTAQMSGAGTLATPTLGGYPSGVDGLSAWTYQVYKQAPQLSGDAALTLSGLTVSVAVPAALGGSGSLSATVAVGIAPTPLGGDGTLSIGYYAILYRTATTTGDGALAAQVIQQLLTAPLYGGGGALAATYYPVVPAAALTTAEGTLTASVSQVYSEPADLNSTGGLSSFAYSLGGTTPEFSSEGTLVAPLVGAPGQPPPGADGLTGWTYQIYTQQPQLSSAANLTGVIVSQTSPANLTGTGALTAAVLIGVFANFGGC